MINFIPARKSLILRLLSDELAISWKIIVASFPGVLYLQFLIACSMQKWREKAGESYYMIRGMADVTDSRHNSLFTFLSIATEKLENRSKFQKRGKSHL